MAPWKRIYWTVWLSNLITSIGMMSFLPFFPTHLAGLGLEDPAEIATWSGLVFVPRRSWRRSWGPSGARSATASAAS